MALGVKKNVQKQRRVPNINRAEQDTVTKSLRLAWMFPPKCIAQTDSSMLTKAKPITTVGDQVVKVLVCCAPMVQLALLAVTVTVAIAMREFALPVPMVFSTATRVQWIAGAHTVLAVMISKFVLNRVIVCRVIARRTCAALVTMA